VAEGLEELRRVDDVGEEEGPPGLALPEERLRAGRLRSRAEALEGREGPLELDGSCVLVARPRVGDAEEHARTSGLVRRAHTLPTVASSLQLHDGCGPVLL